MVRNVPAADRNPPWGSSSTQVIGFHQDRSTGSFHAAAPDPEADTVVSPPSRHVTRRDRRVSSRLMLAGVFVLGVVVLVVALFAGVFDAVPLLNVSAAAVTQTLAAVALLRSWQHPSRRWLRRGLPVLLGVTVLVCVTTAVLLRVTNTITDAYPVSFGLWIAMAILAIVGLPFTGLRGTMTRRVSAYLAVPLTLSGALMLIDQEYGVWPQVGDMLGHFKTVDPATLPKALDATPGPTQSPPKSGVVVNLDVPSTVSHFTHRSGNVYLPPAYFTDARASLPVLLMLAGSLGTPTHWARAGKAVDTVDRYAAAHHGTAPILVFADQNGSATGDTECVDGPQGMAETYLTTDVRTFVVDRLHVTAAPARWGIVGFSEGGTCALDLVLRHRDIYTHIIDLGGDDRPTFGDDKHTLSALYGGSTAQQNAHDPRLLLAAGHRYDGVTAWFTAGADDPRNLGIEQKFAVQAKADGIVAHEFTGISGHNWQFAGAAFARIMPGLAPELGLT